MFPKKSALLLLLVGILCNCLRLLIVGRGVMFFMFLVLRSLQKSFSDLAELISLRPEDWRNTTVPALPAFDEAHAFGNGIASVLGVRAALVDDGRGDHCAHAAAVDDFSNR